MGFFGQRITRLTQLTLGSALVAAGLFPSPGAIAKPDRKPEPTIVQQSSGSSQGLPGRQTWQGILADIRNQYQTIPDSRFTQLQGDNFFRDQLFSLFWGQTGDRRTIQEILVDLLLNGSRSQTSQGYYFYDVDRRCLPPGQQQRLASGKPIPPGILQKCGRPIFRNY
ncbi:hypothetical protein [Synechococcus sp. BDU 130192]|uniref:hypothetical protein n=1 Tax=Synechococcus sp. BDU 130192 TaxID=2042059 RepID=UPI000C0698A1|nr:hypothetical protein [Synechococcus sp. BDU 130192]